ncbi:hypothetical protein NC651_031796 [Populus alba x Populus x berolinensis]|nr:hypothetical protein NC651_031796 [Populus alba x Populus x berolinensis]
MGANIGAQMLLGLLFFKSPFLLPHLVKSGELGRQKYPPDSRARTTSIQGRHTHDTPDAYSSNSTVHTPRLEGIWKGKIPTTVTKQSPSSSFSSLSLSDYSSRCE